MREIVLDTETTGLDPHKGDRLVEIGCVEIVNRFVTGRVFHRYVNPERNMPLEAFQVHGLSEAFLADKPLFKDVADEFLDFIGDDPLIIHNASFDMGFLNSELKRLKKPPLASDRVIDTLILARRRHPGQSNSLDALCARYGIDNARRTKHGALLDSEILAEIYAELTGGKQSSFGLSSAPSQTDQQRPDLSQVASDAPVALTGQTSALTDDEKRQHRVFIAEMGKKAIWNTYFVPETDETPEQKS